MKSVRIVDRITRKENASFKKYLSDISSISMFTKEEELVCCEKVSDGDENAKNELIKRNLRFVVSIAKQFETPTISLEDLVNEGNVGLVLAASRYNPDTGFRFITFAVFWIRKIIYEFISNKTKLIRIPCNKVTAISKYNNKVNELEQKHGRVVDINEALDELKGILPPKEIINFEKFLNLRVDSLDKTFIQGENETSLQELIVDDSIITPDYNLEQEDLRKELNTVLEVLKPRDKEIMINLFGLNGRTPMTLEQVSEQVGLTREMVRQIRQKSLKTLKEEMIY